MLDRGEARALSFSKERQSLWLYLPINRDNHHASIPAQGIALSKIQTEEEEEEKEEERRRGASPRSSIVKRDLL